MDVPQFLGYFQLCLLKCFHSNTYNLATKTQLKGKVVIIIEKGSFAFASELNLSLTRPIIVGSATQTADPSCQQTTASRRSLKVPKKGETVGLQELPLHVPVLSCMNTVRESMLQEGTEKKLSR